MVIDTELDRLFGLPLGEFVAARNALARELRRAGERSASDEVKHLLKPSISVWLVNQLARREPGKVEDLIKALDRLRAAQLAALEIDGGGLSLRECMREEKEAMSALHDLATELLAESGHPSTRATVERAVHTIRSAALNPEARADLEKGRLTHDLEEPGFDGLTALPAPANGARPKLEGPPPPPPIDLEAERRRREAQQHKEEAEERRRREEELHRLDAERHALKKKIDAAVATVEQMRSVEVVLRQETESLDRELADARRRLREAEEMGELAHTKLVDSVAKRQEAESKLAELQKAREALK